MTSTIDDDPRMQRLELAIHASQLNDMVKLQPRYWTASRLACGGSCHKPARSMHVCAPYGTHCTPQCSSHNAAFGDCAHRCSRQHASAPLTEVHQVADSTCLDHTPLAQEQHPLQRSHQQPMNLNYSPPQQTCHCTHQAAPDKPLPSLAAQPGPSAMQYTSTASASGQTSPSQQQTGTPAACMRPQCYGQRHPPAPACSVTC